jgi:hypothetical protein
MSPSTLALTTIVSIIICHISSGTDGLGTAIPRCLREWGLTDSRSAAAATGWGKGKDDALPHIPIILIPLCTFVQVVILACRGMTFSGL